MASKLTIALAGFAVASLPVFVDAQGTSTPQTKPEQPTTTSQQSRSGRADQNSPQHHLDEAKRVLTSVNANNVQGEARSQVNELKRHFMQLETAWRASSAGSAQAGAARSTGGAGSTTGSATTGSATGSTSGTTSGTATGSASGTTQGTTGSTTAEQGRYSRGASASGGDWMTHYNAINTMLDQMIGSGTSASMSGTASTSSGTTGSTTGTSSGSAGSTTGTSAGTTGSAGERTGSTGSAGASASASARIEGDTRTKLTEFKRHLDQFHATAMAQRAPGGEDASAASRSTSSPAVTSHETPEATAATGTTGTMTGTAGTSGTSSTMTGTAGTTGSTGSAAQSAQTPPSTSTQTPQTTSSTSSTQQTSASATVDSAAIARLTASIDEMLRGSASTSTSAGTTTSATGTTSSGTVGTSGTTSATGTVCVDRAKLEALKTQLQALQNRPR